MFHHVKELQLDPPASSYPACIAFKAAELQDPERGERYLRRLRQAVMQEGRNIARREVLLELAGETDPALDLARFETDLEGQAVDAFREDLKEVRYHELGRFPALILRPAEGRAILLVGYRPYEALRQAVEHVVLGVQPVRTAQDLDAYRAFWGGVTPQEVREAMGWDLERAKEALAQEPIPTA